MDLRIDAENEPEKHCQNVTMPKPAQLTLTIYPEDQKKLALAIAAER
jgi:hypothetical protein